MTDASDHQVNLNITDVHPVLQAINCSSVDDKLFNSVCYLFSSLFIFVHN